MATKLKGPYKIVKLFDNYVILTGRIGKRIKRSILHLKPFFAPLLPHPSLSWSEIRQKGEGNGAVRTFDNAEESDAKMATLITSVLCDEATMHGKTINQKIINKINKDLRPHLLEVTVKILINQDRDSHQKKESSGTPFHKWKGACY